MDGLFSSKHRTARIAFIQWLGMLLCLLLSTISHGAEPKRQLNIVINGDSQIHAQFSNALIRILDKQSGNSFNISLVDITRPDERNEDEPSSLTVSVGTEATAWALQHTAKRPVLATLIPEQSYRQLQQEYPGPAVQRSAIFIDQPLRRQTDLLRLIFPKATTIGTLLGPGSQSQAARLEQLLAAHSMTLAAAQLGSQDNPIAPLDSILNSSDVFLALPDPVVFNRHSLAGILLTTYRHRVPVIGFSQAYVQAGALAAAYSSTEQIAQQTAETINNVLTQDAASLPPPAYPRYFSIATNHQVARSLNLGLPDRRRLEQQLKQLEQDSLQ